MRLLDLFNRLETKHGAVLALVIGFTLAVVIPPMHQGAEMASSFLAVIGILFGIVVGFYINDLWHRFLVIREQAAIETSDLGSVIAFGKILGDNPKNKKWFSGFKKVISNYLKEDLKIEWHTNTLADKDFNEIYDYLRKLKEFKTRREAETYHALLSNLAGASVARDTASIIGKDHLTSEDWTSVLLLGFALVATLFFIKIDSPLSILLTGILTSAVIVLFFIIRDLDNLSLGEEAITFEPYEKLFDALDEPRYYIKEYVESGRMTLPKDKKYILESIKK